jgi:hypothetical protein
MGDNRLNKLLTRNHKLTCLSKAVGKANRCDPLHISRIPLEESASLVWALGTFSESALNVGGGLLQKPKESQDHHLLPRRHVSPWCSQKKMKKQSQLQQWRRHWNELLPGCQCWTRTVRTCPEQ